MNILIYDNILLVKMKFKKYYELICNTIHHLTKYLNIFKSLFVFIVKQGLTDAIVET